MNSQELYLLQRKRVLANTEALNKLSKIKESDHVYSIEEAKEILGHVAEFAAINQYKLSDDKVTVEIIGCREDYDCRTSMVIKRGVMSMVKIVVESKYLIDIKSTNKWFE